LDAFQHLPLGAIPIWDQYVDFMEWSLNGLANTFQNGGLAIIAFTIIIKTLLLPFTVKSIRSSKAMQELGPRIKEIQKKHGKDRQKVSQETFALYNQHGVNPMAGCLPMLIQIPIFFGLYRAIDNLSGSGTGHWVDGFLWLQDLDKADSWKLLPILAGVFQFIQSRMMRPAGQGKVTDPQQALMNHMMNFMPLMVIIFGWTFASGPVLYWATQSIYSVVQQWFITGWGNMKEWFPWLPEMPEHRRLGYRPPRPIEDVVVMSGGAGVAQERKGFQGWLATRMAEAQENAQARQDTLREQRAGKAGTPSGARSRTTAAATDGEVIETTGGTSADRKSGRKSTSYQDRVDAATKFGAKTTRSGNGASPTPATSTASASTGGSSRGSGSVPPRRKVKRKRPAS